MDSPLSEPLRWTQVRDGMQRLAACDPTDVAAWQLQQFRNVLEHHRSASAAYRGLLDRAGLGDRWALDSLEAVVDLPLVNKGFLAHGRFAEAPNVTEPVTIVSTSGTTSSAAQIPHNERSLRTGLGDNFARSFIAAGLDCTERHWLIGHWSLDATRPPFGATGSFLSMAWLQQLLGERVLLQNNQQPPEELLSAARNFFPTVVSSAPNLLSMLARLAIEKGGIAGLKTVMYGGAAATNEHRDLWRQAFGNVDTIAFFPTTDAGAIGVSPHDDGVYECFTETHFVEVVDQVGRHVAEGDHGRLVVTSYNSLAAPLIRYQTGDTVRFVGARRNRVLLSHIARSADLAIGDGLLPIEILGQWSDALVAADRSVVGAQLVLRRDASGRDAPLLRIHGDTTNKALLTLAQDLFMATPQMSEMSIENSIAQVTAEIVPVSAEVRRTFKIPLYVDERTNEGEQQ